METGLTIVTDPAGKETILCGASVPIAEQRRAFQAWRARLDAPPKNAAKVQFWSSRIGLVRELLVPADATSDKKKKS